jgi:pyrroline-5-carboxylate reductase
MPNTPAQIGEGMSVWTATPSVNKAQLDQARTILQALGTELYVNDEKFLDMATAVSGTGPTYVFLVMEAMIDAAVHLGFPRHMAYQLVTETMRGSISYAMKSGKHPAELRNLVTSPGGTSAAALYQLEKGGLRTVLSKAILAAYERSKSLGEEKVL